MTGRARMCVVVLRNKSSTLTGWLKKFKGTALVFSFHTWPVRVLPSCSLTGRLQARAQASSNHFFLVRPLQTWISLKIWIKYNFPKILLNDRNICQTQRQKTLTNKVQKEMVANPWNEHHYRTYVDGTILLTMFLLKKNFSSFLRKKYISLTPFIWSSI